MNGVEVFSSVVSVYNQYPANQNIFTLFGSEGVNELDGWLDDLRIYNIALSPTGVKNVMYGFKIAKNLGFNDYDDTIYGSISGLIAHFEFEDLTDSSGKGSLLTLTNSTIDSVRFKVGSKSLRQTNDDTDYVEITPSINVQQCWNNNALTICSWVYVANTTQDTWRIFQFRDTSGSGNTNGFGTWAEGTDKTGLKIFCANNDNLNNRSLFDRSVVFQKGNGHILLGY